MKKFINVISFVLILTHMNQSFSSAPASNTQEKEHAESQIKWLPQEDPRFRSYLNYKGDVITLNLETEDSYFNGKSCRGQGMNVARRLEGWYADNSFEKGLKNIEKLFQKGVKFNFNTDSTNNSEKNNLAPVQQQPQQVPVAVARATLAVVASGQAEAS